MLTAFFHCRTRTMGCKLEVQGKSVMLCLNITLKWNITWHNVIRKQIWLPSHLYSMLARMGPWRNSILHYVYAQLNILLQYQKFKGAFVVNENQELIHFADDFLWHFLLYWSAKNAISSAVLSYSWLSYRLVPDFIFTRRNTWLLLRGLVL